jgi:hypothetical protein
VIALYSINIRGLIQMFRKINAAITVALIIFIATSIAFSQAVSGNISGTVQDATGAAVPNANITIADLGSRNRLQSAQR